MYLGEKERELDACNGRQAKTVAAGAVLLSSINLKREELTAKELGSSLSLNPYSISGAALQLHHAFPDI